MAKLLLGVFLGFVGGIVSCGLKESVTTPRYMVECAGRQAELREKIADLEFQVESLKKQLGQR